MRFLLYCMVIVLIAYPIRTDALMTSTNYTIFADDFNSGVVATGSVYKMEATGGESPAGIATSTGYTIQGGFQSMDRSVLSLSIDSTSINLGDLSTSAVSSASTNITVTAESDSGYTLSIAGTAWTAGTLSDVVGGTVTAGTEAYGYSISGTDVNSSLVGQDNPVTNGTLMNSTTPVRGISSTVTFKAAIDSNSSSGAKAQTVTLLLNSNL